MKPENWALLPQSEKERFWSSLSEEEQRSLREASAAKKQQEVARLAAEASLKSSVADDIFECRILSQQEMMQTKTKKNYGLFICMVVGLVTWAVVGLFIWIPLLVRVTATYAALMVHCAVTRRSPVFLQDYLRHAYSLYGDGLRSSIEIYTKEGTAGEPPKIPVPLWLFVREILWTLVFWLLLSSFFHVQILRYVLDWFKHLGGKIVGLYS